jgi:acetyl esterase/lipase
MWNLLDDGLMKPFHTAILPPIPMSHLFHVPSWTSEDFMELKDIQVSPHEGTELDEINVQVGQREGVVSMQQFDQFHDSLQKSTHYTNHPHSSIKLRLISPHTLPHNLDCSADFPIIHNFCCCGGCASCSHGESQGNLIFHIHGGGFVAMSSSGHESYLRMWAKETGMPIVSVDYSTAPESMFPVQVEECFNAYRWVVNNAKSILGVPLRRIFVVGDSAGGNLSLTLTLKCIKEKFHMPDALGISYPAAYLNTAPSPARLVALVDPLVNFAFLQMCTDSYIDKREDLMNPFISPAVAPDEYLAQFPPTYLNVGTLDPLFDDCMYFAKRLDQQTGRVKLEVYDGLGHGYLNLVNAVPEGMKAAKRLSSWLMHFAE